MSELEPTRTYSNHTATDELLVTGYPNSLRPELHKALKTRGIDYWVAQGITFWNRDDGRECLAYGYKANGVPKLAIKVVGFTDPEQAIAATLGATDARPTQAESSGTCHITDEQPFWHRMADEQPSDERGKYLLVGKRGAMYLANGFHVWEHSGRRSFYIPNNRSGYVDFDKVKAWAVVPEMEVEQ